MQRLFLMLIIITNHQPTTSVQLTIGGVQCVVLVQVAVMRDEGRKPSLH